MDIATISSHAIHINKACNYAVHHDSFIYKYLKRLSLFRASINRPSRSDPERSSIAVQIAAVAINLHLSTWAALSAKMKMMAAGRELYDYGICAEPLKTSEAAAVLMRHWARVWKDR